MNLLQSLDPRTKLAALLCLGIATFLTAEPSGIVIACVVALASGALSGVILLRVLARTRVVLWFAIVILAVNALTVPGKILLELHGFYLSGEGLLRGGILVTRLIALLWMSVVFAETTSLSDLTDAVERTLHSMGGKMHAISAMIMITLQYVPLFIRNARVIKMAQISRGADLDSRWTSQVRFALSASLPLFVSAVRTSSQLALAMESRGFDPSTRRSIYTQLHPGFRDGVAVVTTLLLGALIVAPLF